MAIKFNLKSIANPYTIFSLAWLIAVSLYSLGWAGIFPKLSLSLMLFVLIVIAVFAVTGVWFNKYSPQFKRHNHAKFPFKILMLVNTGMWIANFLYSGIPLLTGLRNDDFGIPSVRVVAVSLTCFLSVYNFYIFLILNKKIYLFYVLYCLSFLVLMISRGNVMMSIATMFFVWLNVSKPLLNARNMLYVITGAIILAFVFGVAGNARTNKDIASYSADAESTYSSNVILSLGDASTSFRKSVIPNEFFWTYLYITSPLSNLQYNVNKKPTEFSFNSVSALFVNEVLLDAVSKKIDAITGIRPKKPALVIEQLTVSTTLAGSYVYAGWEGMAFFILVLWLIPILYFSIIRKNSLGVIGLSTLCTMFFFSMFDNILILTGLTLQLIYPFIFNLIVIYDKPSQKYLPNLSNHENDCI